MTTTKKSTNVKVTKVNKAAAAPLVATKARATKAATVIVTEGKVKWLKQNDTRTGTARNLLLAAMMKCKHTDQFKDLGFGFDESNNVSKASKHFIRWLTVKGYCKIS